MNELHQKILDAARDEVRTDKNNRYKAAFGQEAPEEGFDTALVIERFAALLAMDRQAEFYREISHQGYVCLFKSQLWTNPKTDVTKTEPELYKIFTTPQ